MTSIQSVLVAVWLVGAASVSLLGCAATGTVEGPLEGPVERQVEAGLSAQPPNIVLIIADDLGMGDLPVYGGRGIRTPHIDALAKSGVRMTNGYVSHPVCSPSRAGLFTGRYQQRHGWEFNPAGRDVNSGVSLTERTFADALSDAGYRTGLIGKWHLGYRGGYHPLARGFDEFFGVLAGGSLYIDREADGVESLGNVPRVRDPRMSVFRGREIVEVSDYLTDAFTREAVAFIQRNAQRPFHLTVSHTTPHTPLQATAEYLALYSHVEDARTRVYSAMVASLDASVGAIVAALKAADVYENTLIVFLSDNGCAGYIGPACSNAPFDGYKRYFQEGGVRVPWLMSWPRALPRGVSYEGAVSALDLFATFTAAAGTQVNMQDSVDLLPYVTGKRRDSPHAFLFWRAAPNYAVRAGHWKLIRYNRTDLERADLGPDGRLPPPAGGWSRESPLGQVTLLYNLARDPEERNNVAHRHADVVSRLSRAFERWQRDLPPQSILPAMRSTLVDVDGETVQLFF